MKNLSARWFRGLMGVIRRLVPGRLASHGRGGRSPIPVLLQQDSQPEQRPLPGAYLPRARRDYAVVGRTEFDPEEKSLPHCSIKHRTHDKPQTRR